MDKPCPLCLAVHRPATRSSQPMSACGETSQHLPLKSHLPSVHSNLKKNRFYFSSHDHEHVAHTGGALPARPTADTCALPVAHPTQSHGPWPPQAGGPRATAHHVGCRAPGPNRPRPDKESPPHDPASKPPGPHLSARAQAAASGHAAGPPAPLAPLPPPPWDTRLRATI